MNEKALGSAGVLAFLLVTFWGATAFSEDDPAGKALFVKNKCNTCHAVESAGIEAVKADAEAPDLSNAGTAIPDPAWGKKFVLREVERNGKKHSKPYKGSAKELEAILSWLMALESS